MFLDLGLAGVFQGYYWAAMQPWSDMLSGSQPFWVTRVFAGLAMFGGFLCFVYNIVMTLSRGTALAADPAASPA